MIRQLAVGIIIIFLFVIGVIRVLPFFQKQTLSSIQPLPTITSTAKLPDVPLPQDTDNIRLFFTLINEKKISDAVGMLAPELIDDESSKQAWGVQLSAFESVTVRSLEPWQKGDWTDALHTYKVTVEAGMKLSAANAPIPNYGWEQGTNIRWVTVRRIGSVWRILSLGTGP